MYFEIENTPEAVKRNRKNKKVPEEVKEECPRLILAPFSRPPQVVFENVLVGTTCKKELEVLNPSKQTQEITLAKSLPPGLVVHLPGECLKVEPETCYCIGLQWTATQLVSQRETIRFTNDNRGRHDVLVVMKSIVPTKSKNNQPKFKTSPGKMKKASKRSPIYKKKMEAVRSTVAVKKPVNLVQSAQYKVDNLMNKENNRLTDNSLDSNNYYRKCPFDSPSSLDFNTSEVFSNMLRPKAAILHDTFDKSYSALGVEKSHVPSNVLKPSNKQCEASLSDVFDNPTFSPLKSVPFKNDKLNKGPQVTISVNFESDFVDSVDIKNFNKENSIICVTSIQHPTKWLTDDPVHSYDTPLIKKKIPNTSSPKDINSPNFSINTDFSRISDLSFFPQKFSTEKKILPKINNETHEIVDDSHMNTKLSSDTYTKESPNTPLDCRVNKNCGSEFRHLPSLAKESYPKMCRQSLFKEQQNLREINERSYLNVPEHYPWHSDERTVVRSPPRSLTPPLQSIPEESVPFSDTRVLDRTDKHAETFTINQTFERPSDLSSMSVNRQSTWSKRAVRAEPALWKTPASITKKPTKRKPSFTNKSLSNKTNQSIETNRTISESSYFNYVGNVYSQSSTVDPFLSSTYYYDKEAVANIENEFKRWLNCVLTPPADLDSNVEQKIDVGKAWIENRNKEVPLAPTKEQVCSAYHDNRRLESLRRSARALFRTSEMTQVFEKLQAQIEKKLIAIRNDKNLHLDIGLQKLIMEIILSYNPLWLRIGLETIYGLVLPLKSNNDIEGLTTFIIQRMFKNPFLKNKHSKTSAPNMLLPAYMKAIKQYTLKKFFVLVFFLDQAKQKKLIPHDPCLFRRNVPYKDSRSILINFTKELIAGIGDITKQLRPIGYVVSHKQSYLDEYIYAVHNIAVDIRDGVRLTKVMEVILMRSGLLHQLRTPAISRLQKIHNVQVALNALKEANFVINGDISAADIADGHREKTLSLLWQLIHVFRAPLFEKAANVIQVWWRKKYEVIAEKRKEQQKLLEQRNTAASIIQYWWRRIQYNRIVEHQMHKMTAATIVLQKYWRMWLFRRRFKKLKSSAVQISKWYKNEKLKRQAIEELQTLRSERQELRRNSAIVIQANIRRLLCIKRYKTIKQKIILIQTVVRQFLAYKQYTRLKIATIFVQRKYRGKLLMRATLNKYQDLKKAALVLQRRFRALLEMRKERLKYIKTKSACITIQKAFRAYLQGKNQRQIYLRQKESALHIQRWYRSLKKTQQIKQQYINTKRACTTIQTRYKAYVAGKKERQHYITIKTAAVFIQRYYRNYLLAKTIREEFLVMRKSTIIIQQFYRSWLETKKHRQTYLRIKQATVTIQVHYRRYRVAKTTKQEYCKLKKATICIQQRYKSILDMRKDRESYQNLKCCTIKIQRRFRALLAMRRQRQEYVRKLSAIITLQRRFKAAYLMKQERSKYLRLMQACKIIQTSYRAYREGTEQRNTFLQRRHATIIIQRRFRAIMAMRADRRVYLQKQYAALVLLRRFRARQMMLQEKARYRKTVDSCITIQKFYRARLIGTKERETYTRIRSAAIILQKRWREYKETKNARNSYIQLRTVTIFLQRRIRAKNETRTMAKKFAINKIQQWYISIKQRNECRSKFIEIRTKITTIQKNFRAYICRKQYLATRNAAVTIQRHYRNYKLAKAGSERYLKLRCCTIKLQAHVRGFVQRKRYLRLRGIVLTLQAIYRFKKLRAVMRERREEAALCIQKNFKRYLALTRYKRFCDKLIFVQMFWRNKLITKQIRCEFMQKRRLILKLQAAIRGYLVRKDFEKRKEKLLKLKEEQRRNWAASKIQALFVGHKVRMGAGARAAELRRRWRGGALQSRQQSLQKRHQDAMEVLSQINDYSSLIRTFKSLELLTEVMPELYKSNAPKVARYVSCYMSDLNRSISSVEVLKSGAIVLTNLARYPHTGPKIYARSRITQTLTIMWRLSRVDETLFCILCTYIWLFSKYQPAKQDLTEFLHMTGNHKMLVSMKSNVNRMKKIDSIKNKSISNAKEQSLHHSVCSTISVLPALEPDYGIVRMDKPRYFEDALTAINQLFETYGYCHTSKEN